MQKFGLILKKNSKTNKRSFLGSLRPRHPPPRMQTQRKEGREGKNSSPATSSRPKTTATYAASASTTTIGSSAADSSTTIALTRSAAQNFSTIMFSNSCVPLEYFHGASTHFLGTKTGIPASSTKRRLHISA